MRVAVIIPCYNVAEHVAAALRSVFAQSHADLDVLVLDDGSTDDTLAVVEQVLADHPRRARVMSGPNAGASATRNIGLQHTEGSYVQYLDADDVLHPDKIRRQVAIAEQAGSPAVVVGAYRNRYEDGREQFVPLPTRDPWMALLRTELGTTSANLWKRSAIEQAGAWRADLGSSQDYELLFRLLQAGGMVAWDPEEACIVLKRSRGSISRTHERENWIRYLALRRAIRDHLVQHDPSAHAEAIATADQFLFMAIRVLSKHDRTAAFAEYDRSIGRGFVPQVSQATTPAYVAIHRILGFRNAERLTALLSSLRSTLKPT